MGKEKLMIGILAEIEELIIECINIRSVEYDNNKNVWRITYRNNAASDEVDTDNLLDFLTNG